MRELLSLSRVPTFDSEDVIRRTVTCERCLEPGLYRLDVASGHFTFECSCTHLEATEIHTLRGPGELRLSRPVHGFEAAARSKAASCSGVRIATWRAFAWGSLKPFTFLKGSASIRFHSSASEKTLPTYPRCRLRVLTAKGSEASQALISAPERSLTWKAPNRAANFFKVSRTDSACRARFYSLPRAVGF